MFELAWSEIALILILAFLLIGPKDFPILIKSLIRYINKAKSMQKEFKATMDEIIAEANIKEITDMDGNKQQTYDLTDFLPEFGKEQPKIEIDKKDEK